MNFMNSKLVKAGLIGLIGLTLVAQQKYNRFQCAAPYFSFISHTELQQFRLRFPSLYVLDKFQVEHILSVIRNKTTQTKNFRLYSDRLIRLLLEKAVSEHIKKMSPPEGQQALQQQAQVISFEQNQFCVVVMIRSGNAFLGEALKVLPGTSVGFILVQEHPQTKDPQLIYCKLPEDVDQKQVILTDAMITTGGRINYGYQSIDISWSVNIVSCEKGLSKVLHQFPKWIMHQILFKICGSQESETLETDISGTQDQQ
ncbi:unnamed protein product (macronuclear) [Paramecium tetraurelia]|uniref:uracil phosphoribosyltransferase n=1 Tax=Paramecium tetraurelia TaxID=5888 RepID=A0DJ52_PARTE|nr:uncharacterized protein GSPATT00017426001 [Paramecium tetraurelia]CAK83069.1 unnamed protein product [Paramecium tetraurelia]|eukprot:XP_001450466.1 hypothetical protein (macronuclear) [Paramecium tetraurelia strain d4-2]